MLDQIIIKGAKQHNLKNIYLTLTKNKLVVFTGVSGSGKSSMAMDTIYAEGQRRYVESLSSYARQFLGVMDKPDVETIEGLSPSIAIDQKTTSHNPRSTVGTITEIYDYLRLLFARIGHPHCNICHREISRLSIPQIVDKIMQIISLSKSGRKPVRFLVLSPIVRDRKGEFKDLFINLKAKGFTKIRIDRQIFSLDEGLILIKTNKHSIDVVIDRISVESNKLKNKKEYEIFRHRLTESIELGINLSQGLIILSIVGDKTFEFPEKPKELEDHLFSEKFSCPFCNISIPELEPRIFSFNSPHGACPKCAGIGSLLTIDSSLVLNKNLSITEGAILPFAKLILNDTWYGRIMLAAATKLGIDTKEHLKKFSSEKLEKLLYGTNETIYEVKGTNRYGKEVTIYETYNGVIPELERRLRETKSDYVRNEIAKYLREEICPSCLGMRLKKESLSVTIFEKSIADVTSFSIVKAKEWIAEIKKSFNDREKTVSHLIIRELESRLTFLFDVGLDYLTLNRSAKTLAGGESQRIRLASQIGSGLSGVLYVLDEPSIGLHARDNNRLITTLKKLRDLGNTVIVVEHDREIMENADLIVDFGPQAGEHGGRIIFQGTLQEIKRDHNSTTGQFLSNKRKIEIKRQTNQKYKEDILLKVFGCSSHNLKKIDVSFPLNKFICVSGVSGSGKSTLIVDTLYQAIASYLNPYHREKAGLYNKIVGLEYLKRVLLIDQSPIGRTPRSNPATYTGTFNYIRDIFSQLPEAKMRGYSPGRFSFNVKGGRCEACLGEGELKIEMQFLPDVYVICDVCGGSRFNAETLEVHLKNKNIAEILHMTVEEAAIFFRNFSGLSTKLNTLKEVGLSYIKLGQPAPQLSGGEAQRVKLASELSKKGISNTLYILDEPTTGLHFADLEKLLKVLRQLVDLGNTVIVIEHNMDVLKNADWIIDLGPEGGDLGGYLVSSGTPEDLTKNPHSYTGRYLNGQ